MALEGDQRTVCLALQTGAGPEDPAWQSLVKAKGEGRIQLVLCELAGMGLYDRGAGALTDAGRKADCGAVEAAPDTTGGEDGGVQGS